VQQAATAVTSGVETLRDFGGSLVDRMRNDNSGGGSSGSGGSGGFGGSGGMSGGGSGGGPGM
jgi:hypothetical protein